MIARNDRTVTGSRTEVLGFDQRFIDWQGKRRQVAAAWCLEQSAMISNINSPVLRPPTLVTPQHFCPLHPNKQTRQDGLNPALCPISRHMQCSKKHLRATNPINSLGQAHPEF